MIKKSLLFELGRWDVGGVERVTVVLANEFARRGWRVAISAFEYGNRMLLQDLAPTVAVFELPNGKWLSKAQEDKLAEILRSREVSVVVNQWCVNYAHTHFLRRAMKGIDAKLIAVHHNRPDMNKRIMDANNPILKGVWKLVSAISLRLVYAQSDAFIVLSPSFRQLFMNFVGLRSGEKLFAVANPLTLPPANKVVKEKIILYVGRLEESQKRVSRVIDVWRNLAAKFPDWRLEVVGDGPDRHAYEMAAEGVPRIHFAGFVSPIEYYAKAKILLLTSDFEGFGLVLCEAMASGCVPVVLGSYAAVFDIVSSGSGKIVPAPWQFERFSEAVKELMCDATHWNEFSAAAKQRAGDFEVERVVNKYVEVIEKRQLQNPVSCGALGQRAHANSVRFGRAGSMTPPQSRPNEFCVAR